MTESNQGGLPPRSFEPMMHSDPYPQWGANGWGATWGHHGHRQQFLAPHLAAQDQSERPLVMRMAAMQSELASGLAGTMPTTPTVASTGAPASPVITPGTGTIALSGMAVSMTVGSVRMTVTPAVPARTPRIARPPAGRLIAVLRSVLTRSAYERIIAPYIAQEQHEHYEALLQKDYRQAQIIVARMYVVSLCIAFRAFVAPIVKFLKGKP